jgi:hypothetical protein
MSDTIERARGIIEDRIREIEAERARLEEALDGLGQSVAARPAATPRSAARRPRPARAGRTPRAARGERERQLLKSIQKSPERRVSDHARAMGVRPQQLYPLLRRLQSSGQIERTERGFRVKETSAASK